MRIWQIAVALSVAVTILTWTVLRPHLGLTDGTPETFDPLTPLGVALVNAILVALVWIAVAVAYVTTRAGDDAAARRAP